MNANICIARSAFADFESGQWTFEPESNFEVIAGIYAILPKEQFLEIEAQRDELLAALKALTACYERKSHAQEPLIFARQAIARAQGEAK